MKLRVKHIDIITIMMIMSNKLTLLFRFFSVDYKRPK